MSPVIVQFGPLSIRWYGIMVALSVLVGIWLTYRYGERLGLSRQVVDRFSTGLIVVIFVGARIGYVASHLPEFSRDWIEVVRVDHGGLASHGIYVFGLLYLWWFSRRARVNMWRIADAIAPAILVANILVRVGNFMNGELYGDPTALPWGVVFPTAGPLPRHPLQVYEMITSALFLIPVTRLFRRPTAPGQIFWTTLALMSVMRFAYDLLRSEDHVFGPFAIGNLAAAITFGVAVWFVRTRRAGIGDQGPGTGDSTAGVSRVEEQRP